MLRFKTTPRRGCFVMLWFGFAIGNVLQYSLSTWWVFEICGCGFQIYVERESGDRDI